MFWSQAVITEVYAPNVFMLALTVWLLLIWSCHCERRSKTLSEANGEAISKSQRGIASSQRTLRAMTKELWFVAFALAFGLSLGTHMSDLGFAPVFTVFVLLTDWRIFKRPLTMLAAFGAFLIGVAQFLWIPLQAATINDPLLLRIPLNTLAGMYVCTLGAFSSLRFAFPLTAMPDRVMIYWGYLIQNFTPVGVALGTFGMWVVLFRHPKRFWLFILMYFVNVLFFTEYKVFDLDVFFIPAPFVFAIFVGVGAQQPLDWLRVAFAHRRAAPRVVSIAATLAIVVFLFVPVLAIAAGSARDNNRTTDTAIGDFYKNVFAMLPRDSVLVSQRSVFGCDMHYWQKVNHVRPDVLAPIFGDKRVPALGAPLFTTAQPQTRVERAFDGLTLLGYDLSDVPDPPTPCVSRRTGA